MKIAIVDKFPIIRLTLKAMLQRHRPEAVLIESETLSSLFCQKFDTSFDLLIIGLNQGHRYDIVKEIKSIKEASPALKIIIYDDEPCLEFIQLLLKLGVFGYTFKRAKAGELFKCIDKVISGNRYFCSDIFTLLLVKGKVMKRGRSEIRGLAPPTMNPVLTENHL
jgi:DNA-binding NarL/FixJ family response regulator